METIIIDTIVGAIVKLVKQIFVLVGTMATNTIPLSATLSLLLVSAGVGIGIAYFFRSDNKISLSLIIGLLTFTILELVTGGI